MSEILTLDDEKSDDDDGMKIGGGDDVGVWSTWTSESRIANDASEIAAAESEAWNSWRRAVATTVASAANLRSNKTMTDCVAFRLHEVWRLCSATEIMIYCDSLRRKSTIVFWTAAVAVFPFAAVRVCLPPSIPARKPRADRAAWSTPEYPNFRSLIPMMILRVFPRYQEVPWEEALRQGRVPRRMSTPLVPREPQGAPAESEASATSWKLVACLAFQVPCQAVEPLVAYREA